MPHLWAHRREDNAEAIRLLDEALRARPRLRPRAGVAAWARAQHVVYNWTDDIAADARPRASGSIDARLADAVDDDPTAL